MRFADISIKQKLLLFYFAAGIIPLIVVGLLSSHFASEALKEKSFNHLLTIQTLRKNRIENDFSIRLESLERLNRRNDVIDLFHKIDDVREEFRFSTTPYTETDFYQRILKRHANSLKQYIATYRYQDLLLITPSNGEIIFSLTEPERVGFSLETGIEQTSALSDLVRKIRNNGRPHISDFVPLKNPKGKTEYVAYIGQPFFDADGTLTGIIVVQLGPDLVDKIVSSREGMGETGESYIVSYDKAQNKYEFRTTVHTTGDHRWFMGTTMNELTYWKHSREAQAQGAVGEYVDSTGTNVLVAAHTLNIPDLQWLLVSKIDEDEVMQPVHDLVSNISILALTLIVIITGITILFANSFTDPIFKATRLAQSIANGKLNIDFKINRGDELGVLGRALDSMAQKLREMNWVASGTETMDNTLRGEHDPDKLTELALHVISDHFNAALAGIYLMEPDTDELRLSARYGWTHRDGQAYGKIGLGDGLIGEAALSNKPLYFNHPETDLPVVDYGVGTIKPTHFVAAPIVFESETLGVILIGSFEPFETHEQEFIASNCRNLGIILAAAQNHMTIHTLLKRAQQQENELRISNEELTRQAQALIESERELQTQQEELRVTNEELEEQTRALRNSENELQSQQEELRVTNEELEERSRELERQNRDIEQKNVELIEARDQIRAKISELEQANKYKSEFLANMSHELRTPLNSILILSQLMAENRDENLSQKQVDSAKTINSSGSDLLRLINDILDLSKVEAGKIELSFEVTKISTFVSDIHRVFDDQAHNRNIPFDTKIEADVPDIITTDSHRLQQVIRNLLSNAFKFTEAGRQVTLHICKPTTTCLPHDWSYPVDQTIMFEVQDQGIGIPSDRQDEIFEAFRQADGGTSRKYGGTGLGLSISRSLTVALGGSIGLTSVEGAGSTFRVILPIAPRRNRPELTPNKVIQQSAENAPTSVNRTVKDDVEHSAKQNLASESDINTVSSDMQEQHPLVPQSDDTTLTEIRDDRRNLTPDEKSILIIEDDPSSAEILRDLAHERGFKCLIAEDGKTGLHFADFFKPDAILLDVGLPGIDGWEVMKRLKDNPETRHIPVHFISGTDKEMEALRMGAVGFLTKPVTIEAMDEAFSKLESILEKPVSSLLIVEDDSVQSEAIRQLIGNGDVVSTIATSGQDALQKLSNQTFDCMILDLGLQDMSGFELLEQMQSIDGCMHLPIIIYTGRELSKDEEQKLRHHADSIIIKGVRSPERLLDESSLFLHRIESSLPERQRAMMQTLHNRDAALKDKVVLLVDDDMRNVFALSSILEEKEMSVVIASNGLESLERLKEHPGTDLVLMDIMMPEMDGYQAIREIRKDRTNAKLPIIALTAKAMKGDRNTCIEAGANDYLAKPVDTDKLLSLLRVWLYK